MGLLPTISSATTRPSARAQAHLVLLAGAAPARRGAATMSFKPVPSASAAARVAGGCRGDGEKGGGGARIAGAGIFTSLRRPPAPACKAAPFSSSRGGAVLCLARRADGEDHGAGGKDDGHGVVGAGNDDDVAGGDHCNAGKGGNFGRGKGRDGEAAPAGGGGDGDKEGAGSCGDKGDAEKAPIFSKTTWSQLKIAFLHAVMNTSVLGLVLYLVLKYVNVDLVSAYGKKLLIAQLEDQQIRVAVAEAVKDVVYRATEPVNPLAKWKKMSSTDKFWYISRYYLFARLCVSILRSL